MSDSRHQQHGQAILETAKDHLAAVLEGAPRDGWTAIEWAEAAGLRLDGASFAAVFATTAAQPWEGSRDGQVTAIVPGHPDFPRGTADDEEQQGPPPGLTGPWIP
jgi:hypothetical protein